MRGGGGRADPLLLLGDESRAMIARYFSRSVLFALRDGNGDVVGIAAVTRESDGVFELKNIAVEPRHQRRGNGRALVAAVCRHAAENGGRELLAGTGAGTPTVGFYKKLGFSEYRVVPEFFTENYPLPIIENGVRLRDMLVLRKALRK